MIFEYLVALLVNLFRFVSVILLPRVDRTPLPVPDAESALIHPFTFFLVAPPESSLLYVTGNVLFRRGRETEEGVVVDRICHVLPLLVHISEVGEIRCEGVAVEEQGMSGVDLANSLVYTIVEIYDASVVRIGWLIQRVVSGDPSVVLVMRGELFPQPDDGVLEVLMSPEIGDVGTCI